MEKKSALSVVAEVQVGRRAAVGKMEVHQAAPSKPYFSFPVSRNPMPILPHSLTHSGQASATNREYQGPLTPGSGLLPSAPFPWQRTMSCLPQFHFPRKRQWGSVPIVSTRPLLSNTHAGKHAQSPLLRLDHNCCHHRRDHNCVGRTKTLNYVH